MSKVIENGWSRAVLLNFLETNLYERQGKAITNFKESLPDIQSDLAKEATKDPYNFDFLAIREGYNEKELKDDPTIGLLICKMKDNILAKYASESSKEPIGISEYQLIGLQEDDFKGSLPSIEEIEDELK